MYDLLDVIDVLNHRWAGVLVFIPGINVLYLLFRFLIACEEGHNIPLWKLGVVVAPLCLLYFVVPDSRNWMVTHLILSVIAFMYIRISRGCYRDYFRFSFDQIFCGGISLTLLVFFIWQIPMIDMHNRADRWTKAALNAIIQDDEEAWQDLIHPVYGTDLRKFQSIRKELQENGIVLEEEYVFARSVGAGDKFENGKNIHLTIRLKVGESGRLDREKYWLTVLYQECDKGTGLIEFEIKHMGKQE